MKWFNLGAWRVAGQPVATHEAACRALAVRLGEAAALGPGLRIFDAGCGGGGQLEVWLDDFDVAAISAVDAGAAAISSARQVLADHPLGDRVSLRRARLVADFPDDLGGPWDRVISLDAAYHFDTRAAFFARAARSLAPGGRLALVDLALTDAGDRGLTDAQRRWLSRIVGAPADNLASLSRYRAQLAEAGFGGVEIELLDEAVLDGFVARVASGAHRRDFPARLWPMVAGTAKLLAAARERDWLRCPLICAQLGAT